MKVVRSLLSVLAGFGFFVGALQLIPWLGRQTGSEATGMSLMLMSLAWTILAAALSGFLAGWIAGAHEMPHASALGFLMIGLSILSMQQESLSRPAWYQTGIAGCGPISALIGAAARMFWRLHLIAKTNKRQALNENTSGAASRW